MCLVKKGNKNAVRITAVELGKNLAKPFPFVFSSHPGLGMIRGPKVSKHGEIMLIGESVNSI